jgi:hypothetical protein
VAQSTKLEKENWLNLRAWQMKACMFMLHSQGPVQVVRSSNKWLV